MSAPHLIFSAAFVTSAALAGCMGHDMSPGQDQVATGAAEARSALSDAKKAVSAWRGADGPAGLEALRAATRRMGAGMERAMEGGGQMMSHGHHCKGFGTMVSAMGMAHDGMQMMSGAVATLGSPLDEEATVSRLLEGMKMTERGLDAIASSNCL